MQFANIPKVVGGVIPDENDDWSESCPVQWGDEIHLPMPQLHMEQKTMNEDAEFYVLFFRWAYYSRIYS